MNSLYCDCFSGISGDMFLAALVDAGLPLLYLSEQLAYLNLSGFKRVSIARVPKGALQATQLKFEIDDGHATNHEGSHHNHHRHLADIVELIEASGLPEPVQQTSLAIFRKLGEAEAAVHGCSLDEVHFHEVGAADSILDIVGAAVGLHYFGIQHVYASALPLGSGQVLTQHGWLPLPAPATARLLQAARAPILPSSATVELVTPTGAAILSTLARFEQPCMRFQALGLGAGDHDLPWPNILRLLIGVREEVPSRARVYATGEPATAIDRSAYTPAYAQLADILGGQVAAGMLRLGDKLPSTAQLCRHYQVSPMTVRRAIRILVEQGVVRTMPGNGTFVQGMALSFAPGVFSEAAFQLNA